MTNNKIFLTIMILGLFLGILFAPAASAQTPTHSPNASPGITIVQGKITQSGVLFIILEKTPGQASYGLIQQPAHDPHFEIDVYNPTSTTNLTLSIASWAGARNGSLTDPTWTNISISAPQRQITSLQFSAPFTQSAENMTMEIQGTGYQFQEQSIASPLFPFYDSGELGFFAFITITTGITILLAFGAALTMLRRSRYFPPVQGIKLLFITMSLTGVLAAEIMQNYYAVITTQWFYWEVPIFILSLLIFLSYIPPHVKRGILLRFLADHNQGEAYTEILSILTAESTNTYAPEGYRSASMQYLDKRSYLDFLKRLAGIKTEILFADGLLPDQIAPPRKNRITRYDTVRILKRLTNRKREVTDYDYGYLLTNAHEIRIEKLQVSESRFKKRFMIIPLSGHHSSYIEDFLAGIEDSELKGEKVHNYKALNAKLRAQLMSGTYLNDQSIIDTIGEVLNLKEKQSQPNGQAKQDIPKLEGEKDESNNL